MFVDPAALSFFKESGPRVDTVTTNFTEPGGMERWVDPSTGPEKIPVILGIEPATS